MRIKRSGVKNSGNNNVAKREGEDSIFHNDSIITSEQDFVCSLCGFAFASTRGLNLHRNIKHADEKSLQIPPDSPYCDVCDVSFFSMVAFNQHLRVSARHSEHSQTVSVVNITNVHRTPRKKKRKEPVACEQCDLVFNDARKYHGHFMAAHPDKNRTKFASTKTPCMCEVCGRIFQCFAALRDHRWLHTGERNFKCEFCGKSYRTKYVLMLHKRLHSENRPSYPCPICGKHFSSSANRLKHTFIHTGLRPYECEKCGKAFRFQSERKVHNEYVHLKKPWPKRDRSKRKRIPIIYNNDLQSNNKIPDDVEKLVVYDDDDEDDKLQDNFDDEADTKPDENEMDHDSHIINDDEMVTYGEVEINEDGVEVQYVEDEVVYKYVEDIIVNDHEVEVKCNENEVYKNEEDVVKYDEHEVPKSEEVIIKYNEDDMDEGNTIHVKIKQDKTDVDKIKLEIKQHGCKGQATSEMRDEIKSDEGQDKHDGDFLRYEIKSEVGDDKHTYEVIEEEVQSEYRDDKHTYEVIEEEIKSDYGDDKNDDEVIQYDDVYRIMTGHNLVSKDQVFNDDEPFYIIIKS